MPVRSALRRVGNAHESVIERLAADCGPAVRDISIGKAWDLSTYLNTVVTKEDRDRLVNQIAEAVEEASTCGGKAASIDQRRSPRSLVQLCYYSTSL